MAREQFIIDKIREQRFLPLFYHDDVEVCLAIARTLYDSGVRCIEFTNRGKSALKHFKELVKERDKNMKDLLIGIGTIKSGEDANAFITGGADFLVSPVFVPAAGEVASFHKMLYIPGCMSPQEIHVASEAGWKLIKLFPGNVLGPGFIEAVKPVFPGIDYIITGGVDLSEESFRSWFKAGAVALGLGSKLVSKEIMANKDMNELKQRVERAKGYVKQ